MNDFEQQPETVGKAPIEQAFGAFAPSRTLAAGSGVRDAKLAEQLYRYLSDLIGSGKLPVGLKLPTEKQLCERFRISRPVVREALARLRVEALIITRRGSGSYIADGRQRSSVLEARGLQQRSGPLGRGSKLTDLLRCFELRMAVECDAAYYAALRREPEHLEALAATRAEIDNAMKTKSLDHDAHFRFHLLVAEASGNEFFVKALLLLRQHLEVCMNLLRDMWLIHPGEPLGVGQHKHDDIYNAIRDRRADDASRAMFLHINEARNEIFGEMAATWPPRFDVTPRRAGGPESA